MVKPRLGSVTHGSAEQTVVSLNPLRIFVVLSAISIALVLISFVGVIILTPYEGDPYSGDPLATPTNLAKLVLRFDVLQEGNIPSWYSGMILFTSSILLAVIALGKHRLQNRFRWHWTGLAVLFLAFSLDEVAYLHEGINNLMRERSIGFMELGWVIPGAVFVLVVGLWYARFLLHLPSDTLRWFIVSAVFFLSGSLGLEIVDSFLLAAYEVQSTLILVSNHIQDLLEMLGVSQFIYALMSYIRSHMQPLHLVMS
jgi:hypothetical protein